MMKGKKPGLLIVIGKSKKGPRGLPSPSEPMGDEGDEGESMDDGVGAELGQAVVDAVRSGDGQAVYDAIEACFRECEKHPHEEMGEPMEEEEAAGNEPY